MAWTCTIRVDKDKDDVGQVQCIWNAGQPDQFIHSERIKVTAAAGQALAVRAEAARVKAVAYAQRCENLADIMTGCLNVKSN